MEIKANGFAKHLAFISPKETSDYLHLTPFISSNRTYKTAIKTRHR